MALIVLGLSLGPAADLQSASAATDRSGKAKAAGRVKYSKGRSGSRLKWISPRPDSDRDGSKVDESKADGPKIVAAQYADPTPAGKPTDESGRNPDSPLFSDPFGDKKEAETSSDRPDADAPQTLPEEPKPAGPLPGLEADRKPGDRPNEESPYVPRDAFRRPDSKEPKGGDLDLKEPLLEREMAARRFELNERCPSPEDLKDIEELSTNITPSKGDLPRDCSLGDKPFRPRSFSPITYTWTASGLCHKPLYFEDVQLERYGHMAGPWLQPFASGAHFFLTVPVLPYKMGLKLPNECVYTLGHFRPGNCAPYVLDPIPLSVRGALFEAGAWVAGVYMIP